MRCFHGLLVGLWLLCVCFHTSPRATAADATTLPGGESLIAGLTHAWLTGKDNWGNMSMVTVDGTPVLHAETTKSPKELWDLALIFKTTAAVKKGDVLYAEMTARGWGAGAPEAYTAFIFEKSTDNYEKSQTINLSLSREWRTIKLPFVSIGDYPAGGAQVNLRLGYLPQTVEIKDLRLLNYGTKVKPEALPQTSFTYEGREPQAAWRAAAETRIEQLRKGDLEIRVVDATGKPVPGATVTVTMLRHSFRFGCAVSASKIMGKTADAERYRKELTRLYNTAVPGLELKWTAWENNPTRAVDMLDFLRAQGLDVRGHNLVWPSFRFTWYLPPRLKKGYEERVADPKVGEVNAKAWLRTEVLNHVRDEVTACQGKVVDWDVINEAMDNDDLMKILGPEIVGACFSAARKADPKATLLLNEYDLVEGGGAHGSRQQRVLGWISEIRKAGGPIDALGIQSHFGYNVTAPVKVLEILDRISREAKLPIQITEFDVNVTDERLQADYTRDFLTAAFSSPAVTAFTMWGFWEGDHWLPNAAMYRKDWTPRPSLQEYENLVLKRWWTNTIVTTDATGTCRIRGFLGDYRVQVKIGARNAEAKTVITKAGTVLPIELK